MNKPPTGNFLSLLRQLAVLLLLVSCASNAPQRGTSASHVGGQKDLQASDVPVQPQPKKSIVPDIHAQGQRGEFARAILARSSAKFLNADSNRDYLISFDEAEIYLPHVSQHFLRYDKNGDGVITWQEYLGHDQWPAPVHGE